MIEFKEKPRFVNPLEALAEGVMVLAKGVESLIESGQELYAEAKSKMEDRKIKKLSLAISAIRVLEASDPILASAKLSVQALQKMFPIVSRGYTIDYSEPYVEPCPTHKCRTYRVKEVSYLVWCPLCMDLLEVYE